MATKKPISISRHKISDQKGKTTFLKEFFLEIWLIIEDCKYNREFPCKGLAAILEVTLNSVQYLLG